MIFFQLTYPTSGVKNVLNEINTRFSFSKESSGLFLFEDLRGSGFYSDKRSFIYGK